MTRPTFRRHALATALFAITAITAAAPAFAQEDPNEDKAMAGEGRAAAARRAHQAAEQRRNKGAQKAADAAPAAASRYPLATRAVVVGKASVKGTKTLQAMLKSYNDAKPAEARAAADAVIADASSNPYEKAFAAKLAAQVAVEAQDYPAALRYLNQVISLNSLDNDSYYDAMLQRAQILMIQKDYAGGLQGIDQFLSETHSTKPDYLVTKGNALYRLGRYAEAAAVLKPAVAAAPEHSDWQQLLADSLARSGNAGEAAKLAADVAAKNPTDKRAQINLVQSYLATKQFDKAAQVLEQLRKSGQLTDDNDYRQLLALYANTDGKEKETIAVINEGLAKGVLKPDYNVYVALAQAYYFSEQTGPAIENYKKAGPLGKDGTAYLQLARIYRNEHRIAESKAAAQQALDKGLKNPEEAKKLLALPGK